MTQVHGRRLSEAGGGRPAHPLAPTLESRMSETTNPQPDDICRLVEIDGETIRVHGGSEMSDESRAALIDVIAAAKRKYTADHPPVEVTDPARRERYAEALYGTLEVSPILRPWETLSSLRRAVWYARADAAMALADTELAAPADRAAILWEAADAQDRIASSDAFNKRHVLATTRRVIAAELRAQADEAHQPTPASAAFAPGMPCEHGCRAAADELTREAQQPETQADEPPVVCQGFVWIGQSFATCDRCGQPAWDHAGSDVPVEDAGPFDTRRTVRPWEPGEADRIRAKWAPAAVSQPVRHAPGIAILCADCRAKGHAVCMPDEPVVEPHCDGFPTACPHPVAVPPAPPRHGGGLRCGCYDEPAVSQPGKEG